MRLLQAKALRHWAERPFFEQPSEWPKSWLVKMSRWVKNYNGVSSINQPRLVTNQLYNSYHIITNLGRDTIQLHSGKTNKSLAGKMGAPDWVDVFPIENGDFPASHVSLLQGIGYTLRKFNSSPLNIGLPQRKGSSSNHHSSGASCQISGVCYPVIWGFYY